MNLKKLFDMQKKLDEKILERFPHLRNEDLLPKKILALQVELGELCNCWRGFKFWSKNQEPNTREYLTNYTEQDSVLGPGAIWKNPLLEEFVDCLHFALSVGLEIGYKTLTEIEFPQFSRRANNKEIIDTFYRLFFLNSLMLEDDCYKELFRELLVLGAEIGFSWEQIEEAYKSKNRTNHQRQVEGY